MCNDRRSPFLRIRGTSIGHPALPAMPRSRSPGYTQGWRRSRVCTRTLDHLDASRTASISVFDRGTRRTLCRGRAPSRRGSTSSACTPTCWSSSGPCLPNRNLGMSCRRRGTPRSRYRKVPWRQVFHPFEPTGNVSLTLKTGRLPTIPLKYPGRVYVRPCPE